MFFSYAAVVKNLRGVVLFDPGERGVAESLTWLVKRFRYRSLGLPPALAKRGGELAGLLQGRPFRELAYPVGALARLVDAMVEAGLIREVAELLVFSSTYISPALVIGDAFRPHIERLAADSVLTDKKLSVRDWKLHLRIADYTILDFYEEAVMSALEAIKHPEAAAGVLERRRKMVAADKKRYWRLRSDAGRPFLHYVDVLSVAYSMGLARWQAEPDWAAAMAIVPVVHIPPGTPG